MSKLTHFLIPLCAACAVLMPHQACARERRAMDVTRVEAPNTVPTPEWSFEKGWLTSPGIAGRGEGWAANVTIADHGPLLREGAEPTLSVSETPGGGRIVTYRAERGELRDCLTPCVELGASGLRRRLAYTNTSDATQDITQSVMRIAARAREGATAWAPEFFRMVETEGGPALCVSYWSAGDPWHLRPSPDATDIRIIETRVSSAWRLEPGQTAEIGEQGIWTGPAGEEAMRSETARWYASCGLELPLVYPDWLRRGILYEASAGGHMESGFSDGGGFDAFAGQVDYLADLGVSVLWLNAVHEHKAPPGRSGGWNHYGVLDYAKVDTVQGGPEALKRLDAKLGQAGIRHINEIVPHGGLSVQSQALESWWTRGRDGEPLRPWGGNGMDNASPEWQATMREAVAMVARDCDIEGVRIDVADGQGFNWGSPGTNHASFSTLGAGVEMLEAVRDGVLEGKAKRPVLIPESPLHPEYFAVPGASVVGYGFETSNVFKDQLGFDLADAARINAVLREHFENERGSLPRGALTIRSLNTHDTVVESGRAQQRFGAGLARALYGVCLALPGVPMLYHQEEIGSFEALRRMNWARRRIPELGGDIVVFPETDTFAPEVFTAWRSDGDGWAAALVNLSGKTITATLDIPEQISARDGAMLYDGVSGEESCVAQNAFSWSLAAYETALIRIGKRPEGAVPPSRYPGSRAGIASAEPASAGDSEASEPESESRTFRMGDVTATLEEGGEKQGNVKTSEPKKRWHVEFTIPAEATDSPLRLRIDGADRWLVSGRTALLDDRVIRRNHPFPPESNYVWRRNETWGKAPWGRPYNGVCPSGRLWQTLFEPLHPDVPALAFVDASGKGFAIENIRTDAMQIVLTDATDEMPEAPHHLELRFLAVDKDLDPIVQRMGMEPWRQEGLGHVPNRPLRVSFDIVACEGDARARLAAERLPFEMPGPVLTSDGVHSQAAKAHYLPEPGTITWTGLAAVEGTYRIALDLRHSERSGEETEQADAYTIEIDGETQPLEWIEHNNFSYGNSYFGRALTSPLDLGGRPHTIRIVTDRTWCAVREGFTLVALEE